MHLAIGDAEIIHIIDSGAATPDMVDGLIINQFQSHQNHDFSSE